MTRIVPVAYNDFNPRSHEGSDDITTGGTAYFVHFNPRSHEGSDSTMGNTSVCRKLFQSTLPRRERLLSTVFSRLNAGFQSTLPRRERRRQKKCIQITVRFQSTLPRRERRITDLKKVLFAYISIHAPTKGATVQKAGQTEIQKFQSTLPRRERRIRQRGKSLDG